MFSRRHYSPLDELLIGLDRALGQVLGKDRQAGRENPASAVAEASLSLPERRHASGLMRVDHAGEVCAQALYQGQGLTARAVAVRAGMQHAAAEEVDHLVWCEQRLRELGSRPSYLNPLWYLGSLSVGALTGLCGDKWSLGFVMETEHQVVRHLESHLGQLPQRDEKSRRILEQMKTDEGRHATVALEAGAAELPPPAKSLMRACSRILTTTAYWI